MAHSRLVIQNYAGVLLVSFQDSAILNSAEIDQIAEDLYELIDKRAARKLIVDFTNVKHLGSQTLGVLLELQKRSRAIKGTLLLCSMREDLRKMFSITKLDKLFTFFPDDTAALRHFGVPVTA